MCNNCIHAPVCGKCKATGGQVGKCEYFREEQMPQRPERAIVHDDELWKKAMFRCPRCAQHLLVVEVVARPDHGFERLKQEDKSPFCRFCGQALDWGDPYA